MGVKVEGRKVGLAAKLELLGPAGQGRLERAWNDEEVTTAAFIERFPMSPDELVEMREMFGPKAKSSSGTFVHGQLFRRGWRA